MQTLFKRLFTDVMPVEQLEQSVEAIALLEDVGFTSPFEPLQEILELGTTHTDIQGVITQVTDVLDDALNLLLQAYGVEVTESTPLVFKTQLGRLITQLDQYALPGDIQAIIDGTFDGAVIVAELMAYAALSTPEEALEYIRSVNDALIGMLSSLINAKATLLEAQSAAEQPAPDRQRYTELNRLLNLGSPTEFSLARELIAAGAAVGVATPEALVNQYVESLTLTPPDTLTREVLGLVALSSTPKENWITTTRSLVTEFTDLMADLRTVDRVLNEHRLQLQIQ